ncbi:MAG: hypothetical protein AB9891_02280 [Anaerolineaceae bacterium]
MKKILVILALVGVTAFAFAFTGNVLAQTVQPPVVEPGFGPGMMGGGFRGGMMGARGTGVGTGLMHDAMVAAFAEKLGLSVDDLNARLTAGETMYDIAAEKGLSVEDFTSLMTDVRASALDDAVAAGTITQEQADFMKTRGAGMMGGRGRGRKLRRMPLR